MKTLEIVDGGHGDIVAYGRRDLVTGSRAKQPSPRFKWVDDFKTFNRALDRKEITAGVLALDEPARNTAVGKWLAGRVSWRRAKPLILVGKPKVVDLTGTDLFRSPMVKYLPAHVGETGVENALEVMKRIALQHAVDRLHQKGILPDTASTKILFNPKSQRLDFTKVAKLFGIPARRLAAIIGVLPTTANKTPDSRAIHEKLLPFERIARGLSEMDNDEDRFRRWLNTPNSELSDATPLQVIEKEKVDAVADMVSSALLGQPI